MSNSKVGRYGALLIGVTTASAIALFISRHIEISFTENKIPTLEQISRRFIEFFPENLIPAVIHHFVRLVDAGVDPSHAFVILARKSEQ